MREGLDESKWPYEIAAACRVCRRVAMINIDPECNHCVGTRREPLPWTELFPIQGKAYELTWSPR